MYCKPLHNRYILLLLCCWFCIPLESTQAQTSKIDSLKNVLKNSSNDSAKALLYPHLWKEYFKVQPDSAGHIADLGIALSKQLNYTKGLAYNYHNKGVSFTHSHDLDSCLFYYQKAIKLSEKLKDSNLLALVKLNTGNIYSRKELPEEAVVYFKEFLEISKALKNKRYIGFAHNSIGMALYDNEQYDNALGHFLEARTLFLELDNQLGVSKVYNNLALLYMNSDGQYLKAIREFEKALVINTENSFKRQAALNLNNIGVCHNRLGEYEKAIDRTKQSGKIYREIKDDNGLAYNAISLGDAFFGLKRYPEAIVYFKSAMNLLPESNKGERVKSLKGLASCFERLGKKKEAKTYYQRAFEISAYKALVDQRIDILKTLTSYSVNEQKFEKAYEYLNESVRLNDSLTKIKNRKSLQRLQVQYETSEMERANTDLTLAIAQKDISIAKQQTQTGLIISFLIFSILIAFVWHRRFKDKKKAMLILADKNTIIEKKNVLLEQQGQQLKKSLREKELLIREIHHRVKNNLQLISSFLNIQERAKKNLDIKTFVANGQIKIRSMVLVHEILHASERLDEIPLQIYIENLVDAIDLSFKNTTSKIEYHIHAEEVYLDINQTMSIGLILNELIYNSLKYAFSQRESGKIEIIVKINSPETSQLSVIDNGVGFAQDPPFKMGLGLELVELMSKQLGGGLKLHSMEKGTNCIVTFKNVSHE